MKASVVVPVYNMEKYVGDCIRSVLAQTCADFEIIVVDDCSTDGTVEVVRSFLDARVRLIQRKQNGGVTKAVNDGFRVARGEYFCPLGADDVLEPWMIEKQSAYLDAHHECGAVFGMPLSMSEDGKPLDVDDKFSCPSNRSRLDWYNTLLEGNTLMGQTMLCRTSLLADLGYWDEELHAGNDIDWFIRVVKVADIYVQHMPMARVRMRDDPKQLSADSANNRRKFEQDMTRIRAKHLLTQLPEQQYKGMVLIATPFPSGVAQQNYVKSMLTTATYMEKVGIAWDWINFESGDNICRAKNALCARFLDDPKYTDLMFIDPDKSWNALAIARLLAHEEEIVGGAYPDSEWTVKIKLDRDGIPMGRVKTSGPLIEAENISTGFVRFKRAALERFRDATPELLYTDKKSGMAFDYQCTDFFAASRDKTGDEVFCERWTKDFGRLWIEPQIDFEVVATTLTKGNLDKHYRDLKEQERQQKERV